MPRNSVIVLLLVPLLLLPTLQAQPSISARGTIPLTRPENTCIAGGNLTITITNTYDKIMEVEMDYGNFTPIMMPVLLKFRLPSGSAISLVLRAPMVEETSTHRITMRYWVVDTNISGTVYLNITVLPRKVLEEYANASAVIELLKRRIEELERRVWKIEKEREELFTHLSDVMRDYRELKYRYESTLSKIKEYKAVMNFSLIGFLVLVNILAIIWIRRYKRRRKLFDVEDVVEEYSIAVP